MSRRDLALEGARALDARRPVNENKALAAMRRTPYGRPGERRATCAVCRCALRDGGTHCNACAYARGVCSGCGVKIMDVSAYNGHDATATTTTNARDAAASVRDRADVSTEDVERKEAVKTRARVGTKATAMAKEAGRGRGRRRGGGGGGDARAARDVDGVGRTDERGGRGARDGTGGERG